MERLTRPLLVFDGDCAFCRLWIARWRATIGGALDVAPSQEAAARFPEVPAERFRDAVVLIEPAGRVTRGAEAVFRALALARGHELPLDLYYHLPGLAWASELVYRLIARHRDAAFKVTR